MNYIDEIKEELSKHITVGKGLMRVYSLLVLIKGEEVTLKDVHDAWAVNINENWDKDKIGAEGHKIGDHWSVIPFDRLKQETQEKDKEYVTAIRDTALILKGRNRTLL
jgi:hypothetical protein